MKKSKFSEYKIASILTEIEAGAPVLETCQNYNISKDTYYNWKRKYKSKELKYINKIRELEEENLYLRKMFIDASIEKNRLLSLK